MIDLYAEVITWYYWLKVVAHCRNDGRGVFICTLEVFA